jgi:hypothetical protein
MDNKGKSKLLTIRDEINNSVQVHTHTVTHVAQASWLRLSVPRLNPVEKNCDGIEISVIQCRPFFKQQKPLKYSLLEEVESALAA